MTAVLVLLLGCAAFVAWACVHVHRRSDWHRDEVEAALFMLVLASRGAADACSELAALTAKLAAENERARRELWGLTQ